MTLGLPVYVLALIAPFSTAVLPDQSCPHIPSNLSRSSTPLNPLSVFLALQTSKLTPFTYQRRSNELLRQLRRPKPLHHLRQGHRRPLESPARRRRRRHGDGYGQEGKAGAAQESDAGGGGATEQTVEEG